MSKKKTDKVVKSKVTKKTEAILEKYNEPIVEPVPTLNTEDAREKRKLYLLSILNDPHFSLPFLSLTDYEILKGEGLVINEPSQVRLSQDNTMRSLFPFNEDEGTRGVAGSRARSIFVCALNLNKEYFKEFEEYNRRQIGRGCKGGILSNHAYLSYRTLGEIARAFFPSVQAEIKTLFPVKFFKEIKVVPALNTEETPQ